LVLRAEEGSTTAAQCRDALSRQCPLQTADGIDQGLHGCYEEPLGESTIPCPGSHIDNPSRRYTGKPASQHSSYPRMRVRRCLLPVAALLVSGCIGSFRPPRTAEHVPLNGCPRDSILRTPRKLAIFFDGTSNDEGSHTNVSKLHGLATLQARCDVNALYVPGVGVRGLIGAATGYGIGQRARTAYVWLAQNYDPTRNDSVFVFGFSRGAFTARVFASMIYAAGLPNLIGVPDSLVDNDRVNDIYNKYKDKADSWVERKSRAEAAMKRTGWSSRQAEITFMGLFETVEAVGVSGPARGRVRPLGENVEATNQKYADQLCNVKRAAHAMSLDDPRAFIFTPKLLTREYLIAHCPNRSSIDIDSVVEEVWFSGAHSDVGGQRGTELDDVPLNWMIRELAPYKLLRGDGVYADPFGPVNNPRSKWLARRLYGYRERGIADFIDDSVTQYNRDSVTKLPKLKVHYSVIQRLQTDTVPKHGWQNEWYDDPVFQSCFTKTLRQNLSARDTRAHTNYVFEGRDGCRVDIVR
jgi:hypothetical protein